MRYGLITLVVVLCSLANRADAQFSPGELSKAHMHLEGLANCSRCHEVGKEISGANCLACHKEIKNELDVRRGYHFTVSSRKCTACHKEHIGRDVRTTMITRANFDHTQTGFPLAGKHAAAQCEDCHAKKNIKDDRVLDRISSSGRVGVLGLSTSCVGCHVDRHQESVGTECQTCHTAAGWTPASTFDHKRTRFQLTGKHTGVECAKCHPALTERSNGRPILFSTKGFSDCSSCHVSPHSEKFAGQRCMSCHTSEGWSARREQGFDHNLTSFKLIGRHESVQCQQCHKQPAGGSAYKIPHAKCTDCHVDYHRREFTAKYDNDCLRCHTMSGFKPSTFTHESHARTGFALTGAHVAIPCARCHSKSTGLWMSFRISSTECVSCHRDIHDGQFASSSGRTVCGDCHTTRDWIPQRFVHSTTRFPLAGRHQSVKCGACHKRDGAQADGKARFRGTDMRCSTCHEDQHAGQFVVSGETDCSRCHSANSWASPVFDHNRQSEFHLTGAHARVECTKCHTRELAGGKTIVRFKPLSRTCESCHGERRIGNE